jgi:hypothetical protein
LEEALNLSSDRILNDDDSQTQHKSIENTTIFFNTMFTIHVLSQKVDKLPVTSTDLCYIITKNHCINDESKNTVKQNNF